MVIKPKKDLASASNLTACTPPDLEKFPDLPGVRIVLSDVRVQAALTGTRAALHS